MATTTAGGCAAGPMLPCAAALLLVLAVAVPSAVRLSAPHGVITSTGDPHEAYLAACYAIENQSLPMA